MPEALQVRKWESLCDIHREVPESRGRRWLVSKHYPNPGYVQVRDSIAINRCRKKPFLFFPSGETGKAPHGGPSRHVASRWGLKLCAPHLPPERYALHWQVPLVLACSWHAMCG